MRRLGILLGIVLPVVLAGCTSSRPAASVTEASASIAQTAGPAGGHIDLPGGSIEVPRDAFATETAVRVTMADSPRIASTLGPAWHRIGPGIRVDLDRQPSTPLTLTLTSALPSGVDVDAAFLAADLAMDATSSPGEESSPGQVSVLSLTATGNALTALLPGSGWFGAGWLDAKAAAERLAPQIGQAFLEFTELRTPRPADCRTSVPTRSGVVSFGSAAWLGDPDPDIWACLRPVPADDGKVAVTLTDNRPLLWRGTLPADATLMHRDLFAELWRGHGYALLVQGLNDLASLGRSSGPELGPGSAITVEVPVSVLDAQLEFVPDPYSILLGTIDFGLRLLLALQLGAATALQPMVEDLACLYDASTALGNRMETILDAGTMTLENFVFLARILEGCWEQYARSPVELMKGLVDFGLLLLTSGLPAMYNIVDPVVRMLSGATSVVVPLHLEPSRPESGPNQGGTPNPQDGAPNQGGTPNPQDGAPNQGATPNPQDGAPNQGGSPAPAPGGGAGPVPGTEALIAPEGLTATPVDDGTIRLAWTDRSSDESGFEINNGDTSRTVGADVQEYLWDGLTPEQYMCFKVRAVRGSETSDWHPATSPFYVCATTPASPGRAPAPPGDVHGDQFGTRGLVWIDQSDNEDGFRVYLNGALVGTEPADSTQLHGTLVGSCSDTLVVSSFNEFGESPAEPIGYCFAHY